MTRPVVTLNGDATLIDAAHLMQQHNIRRVVVVDGDGSDNMVPRGIISKHDVLHACPPNVDLFWQDAPEGLEMPLVGTVMTRNIRTIHAEAPVEEAAILLRDLKIGALPVVLNNRLAGIITESDIFKALTQLLMGVESSMRITFDISETRGLFESLFKKAQYYDLELTSINSFEWNDRKMAVVRVYGASLAPFVDWLWASGHKVLDITSDDGDQELAAQSPGFASQFD